MCVVEGIRVVVLTGASDSFYNYLSNGILTWPWSVCASTVSCSKARSLAQKKHGCLTSVCLHRVWAQENFRDIRWSFYRVDYFGVLSIAIPIYSNIVFFFSIICSVLSLQLGLDYWSQCHKFEIDLLSSGGDQPLTHSNKLMGFKSNDRAFNRTIFLQET